MNIILKAINNLENFGNGYPLRLEKKIQDIRSLFNVLQLVKQKSE